jgi:hypothetical protein
MSPLLDQLLVVSIVAGAASYFLIRTILRRRKSAKTGCVSDCGCASPKPKILPLATDPSAQQQADLGTSQAPR